MINHDVGLSLADTTSGHPAMQLIVAGGVWRLECGDKTIILPSATAAMAAKDLLDKGLRAYNEMML